MKEREERLLVMGENIINHFCHEHPLILTKNMGNKEKIHCYGCHQPIISELAYVCSQQNYCSTSTTILHKRCAEMPSLILHPSHPDHPLYLFDHQRREYVCSLCGGDFEGVLHYRCFSCEFDIDISCEQLGCIDDLVEGKWLQHPSHSHLLTLMRKPASVFYCDGCGTEDRDMAYVCSPCEFWIHKTCALLPSMIRTNHHHHPLSLAFCLPIEYHRFEYKCDVCDKECHTACWVYYCRDCRYFAHVKCATPAATKEMVLAESSNSNTEKNDGSDLIQLPARDILKALITPFIMKNNGSVKIPDINDMPASISMPRSSMLFNYHKHPLSLVSEGAAVDDDLMICDACITPIYSPPYYNCSTCNCFLHSTCCLLPKTLSCLDSQLYGDCPSTRQNHKLTAYISPELDKHGFLGCGLCLFLTDGMVYRCEDCGLCVDVKCASLPTAITHASHPQHKLIMKRKMPGKECRRRCGGCGLRMTDDDSLVAYYCNSDGCGFALDLSCVLLPKSIKHEWDKHPLLLTYNASLDHPTDFYCEICEEEMHPKRWMYHCRERDRSFHTDCLKTESGWYRNIKFGRQFEFDHRIHPHALTYNLVTHKLWCDACHRYLYRYPGFECASCNYVLCHICGVRGDEVFLLDGEEENI